VDTPAKTSHQESLSQQQQKAKEQMSWRISLLFSLDTVYPAKRSITIMHAFTSGSKTFCSFFITAKAKHKQTEISIYLD
jgi:hypothetical protein